MQTFFIRGSVHPPGQLILAVAALALACSACKKKEPAICRLDYELINGAESERYDVFEVDQRRNLVTRVSYLNGSTRDQAIYYYFDDAGNVRLEALDATPFSDIEARLDAQPVLGDVLVPFAVDMNLQDGSIDTAQYSLIVPTSTIGPWNPARIFYQLPCDQDPVSDSIDEATGERTFVFTVDPTTLPAGGSSTPDEGSADEGSADEGSSEGSAQGGSTDPSGPGEPGIAFPPGTRTVMTVSYDDEGRPVLWAIDIDGDGVPNDTATLTYNELGLISELYWTRPGRFFGQVYSRGRWTYDTDGKLYSFELDANGDLAYESRAIYHETCFEGVAP
jgi:hypothetical protein